MKRDNWRLGNGIVAGDDVLFNGTVCHVIKVSGHTIKGYESGNVLIEFSDKSRMAVLGSELELVIDFSRKQ